ncbi:MAG TPA: hypothetical protein VFA32_21970 [Dehalococcoidia bacterium]|jgi:hypothetical protein|nr:hypothetical protein [Dehalococcoidia bacterium]
MISRYRGKLGEYLWQKEMQRLERYKDRPWELQSRSQTGSELFVLTAVCVGGLTGLLLLSLF